MTLITVQANIQATINKVWTCFTLPKHIVGWNHASEDWHCPSAKSEFKPGGQFSYRMSPKGGDEGFEFRGTFKDIQPHALISYFIEDGRKVEIRFAEVEEGVVVTEVFEMENIHTEEEQRAGWQAILDNFKAYVEKA